MENKWFMELHLQNFLHSIETCQPHSLMKRDFDYVLSVSDYHFSLYMDDSDSGWTGVYPPTPPAGWATAVPRLDPSFTTVTSVVAPDVLSPSSRGDTNVLPEPVPAPKQKIHIDVRVETLGDLIGIIDAYPYSPEVEANIDLKSLHNIDKELREINSMIGLSSFKETLLNQLLYFIQGLHLNRENDYKHTVIYGPPGTGKTQVAKLIGQMYSKLNVLKAAASPTDPLAKPVFRKVTRNDLVAGYLGQTAIKTRKVIEECLGGCLFIDEVYSLGCGGQEDGGGDSFSKECIDTLCEALSDHRDDLMVIVAGYEKDVKHAFFGMNPGLSSRFIWRFSVAEYTSEELMKIFIQKVEQNGWSFDATSPQTTQWFKERRKQFPYFGRDMEQLFTYTKVAHGKRIFGKECTLRKKITLEDLDQGYACFLQNTEETTTKLPESCYGLYM